MNKLLLIKSLDLPYEIQDKILIEYKYDRLHESIYIPQSKRLITHMQYYLWLNKKLNKKDKSNESILKTIKEFDYYEKLF